MTMDLYGSEQGRLHRGPAAEHGGRKLPRYGRRRRHHPVHLSTRRHMRSAVLIGEDHAMCAPIGQTGRRVRPALGRRGGRADSVDLVVVDLAAPGAIEEVAKCGRAGRPRSSRATWPCPTRDLDLPASARAATSWPIAARSSLGCVRCLQVGRTGRRTFPCSTRPIWPAGSAWWQRLTTTPLGPVAIYQVDGAVHASPTVARTPVRRCRKGS